MPATNVVWQQPSMRGRLAVVLAVCALALTAVLSSAPSADAAFGIVPDSFVADAYEEDGSTPVTQAGAHPFQAETSFAFNTHFEPHPLVLPPPFTLPPVEWTDDAVRDITVDLPPGFVGNPRAMPRCPASKLTALSIDCPPDTQVGYVIVRVTKGGFFPPAWSGWAVYNMEVGKGELATLGFHVGVAVRVGVSLDPSDYHLQARIRGVNNILMLMNSRMVLWGVPADPSHYPQRCAQPHSIDDGSTTPPPNPPVCGSHLTLDGSPKTETFPAAAGVPARPFLSNPSDCGAGPLTSSLAVSSWQDPNVVKSASFTTASPVSGCGRVPFDPSLAVDDVSSVADSPSGLGVDLAFGRTDGNPNGLDVSPVRDTRVALPGGLTINPGSADGLQACSDAQLGLGTDGVVSCPLGSQIGTVSAESPALEEPMVGGVFLRSQASDDPESGEMFRLALVVRGAGQTVKLAGEVSADAETGRLVASFRNNPQLPVSRIRLQLKDGPRAPLATPKACGTHTVEAQLVSWSGAVVGQSPTFDTACAEGLGGFGPSFDAGTVSPTAGRFSPFVLRMAKSDGQSDIDGVSVDMPEGLLARLKGNLGTRVGTARVAAGPGSSPFWLSGPVVLEGAYGDAPYSLRVTVPAKAGPFDLGDVVVRQKVYVDPATAKVRVVSDPLPTIVKGVPVRLQNLAVDIDKPGFAINPTSCEQKRVSATVGASTGQTANVGSRFQVGDCQALPFKPRLAMKLTGRRQTTTGRHPGIRATVRQTGLGEAAIRQAKVTLPSSLALDPDNAQALCEHNDGIKADLENHCPKGSIVGKATARTPLLDRPLSGDVYFVKNVRKDPRTGNLIRTLPMLVVALRGEIAINLIGESSTARSGRLVNTFNKVPDAPIARFDLDIYGGNTGILAVTRTRQSKINLCARPTSHPAQTRMQGHNGKRTSFATRVTTPCPKAKASRKHANRRR